MEKNEICSPFPRIVAEFKIRRDGANLLSVKKDKKVSLLIKEEVENQFFEWDDEEDFVQAVSNFQNAESQKKKLAEMQNKHLKIRHEKPVEYVWQQAKVSKMQRNSSKGFVSRCGLEYQQDVDQWLSEKEIEVSQLMADTPFYTYQISIKWQN